jgi:hypothetical protein
VVPVLVVEKTGPVDAVKRSFAILRKAWGESVTAHFSIGFFVFLASLVAIAPIIGGGMAIAAGQTILGGVLIACGVSGLILVSLISTTLDSILLAALYLYAADGQVPTHFDDRLLRQAFGE